MKRSEPVDHGIPGHIYRAGHDRPSILARLPLPVESSTHELSQSLGNLRAALADAIADRRAKAERAAEATRIASRAALALDEAREAVSRLQAEIDTEQRGTTHANPSFLLVEMYVIDPAQIFSAAGSITGYNGSLRPCERRSQQLQRLLLDGCWAGCHRQHVIGIGCSGYLVEA